MSIFLRPGSCPLEPKPLFPLVLPPTRTYPSGQDCASWRLNFWLLSSSSSKKFGRPVGRDPPLFHQPKPELVGEAVWVAPLPAVPVAVEPLPELPPATCDAGTQLAGTL